MRNHILFLIAISICLSCNIKDSKFNFSNTANNNQTQLDTSYFKIKGLTQGTYYSIAYIDNNHRNLKEEIDSILVEFSKSLSQYDSTSTISKFNNCTDSSLIDELIKTVYSESKNIAELTNGSFDYTIAPLVNAWGFGWKEGINPDSSTIDSLLNYVDYKSITFNNNYLIKSNKNIVIDFNSIAQGYSVDIVSNYLEKLNINNFLVEIGGEIKAKGKKKSGQSWIVGISNPETTNNNPIIRKVKLDNKSMATSGNYRKFYIKDEKKYSHTINPNTGYPVEHNLLSATVITDKCIIADAYATAFMVMGVEKTKQFLTNHPEIEVFLIYYNENNKLKTFSTKWFKKYIE